MDNKSKVCHDLKTERLDVAPPLPAVASALPIAFFLGCIAAVGLNVMFWLQAKDANEKRDGFTAKAASEARLQGETVAQRESLKKEEKRAKDVLAWVNGSRSFQPVVVSLANSIDAKASIVELALNRDASNSEQIKMKVKLDGLTNDRAQIELIEGALLEVGYRTYNAQQTRGQGRGSLSYEATLLRTQNNYDNNITSNSKLNDE